MARLTVNTHDPIYDLLTEMGFVDPVSTAHVLEQHAEMIEAYRQGKITAAALKHSLTWRPDEDDG